VKDVITEALNCLEKALSFLSAEELQSDQISKVTPEIANIRKRNEKEIYGFCVVFILNVYLFSMYLFCFVSY
jgi:hypothetical protein